MASNRLRNTRIVNEHKLLENMVSSGEILSAEWSEDGDRVKVSNDFGFHFYGKPFFMELAGMSKYYFVKFND